MGRFIEPAKSDRAAVNEVMNGGTVKYIETPFQRNIAL